MPSHYSEDVLELIRSLIESLTKFEVDSMVFKYCEKYAITNLEAADSMFFLNKKEIDRIITSLGEKFEFHGFLNQSKDLTNFYKEYVNNNLPKHELNIRLNVIKLLVSLSERPTSKLVENPYGYRSQEERKEEIIDWPAYLKEGVELWIPNYNEDTESDSWTDEEDTIQTENEYLKTIENKEKNNSKISSINLNQSKFTIDYSNSKDILQNSVQNTWFDRDNVRLLPESHLWDANIVLHWENFLEKSTNGLLPINHTNLLTEYKVVREVLWQLLCPHEGVIFKFNGSKMSVKSNVTIPSVRNSSFETFMPEFVPYIEVLKQFRDFHNKVLDFTEEQLNIPDTYQSYAISQQNILKPVYKKIVDIEFETANQESIMTLTKLARDLKLIFEPVRILNKIHNDVILNTSNNSTLNCATMLLTKLHMGIMHCTTKLEQDIFLTLYLESLFKYMNIINSWLSEDLLSDAKKEFVITDVNKEHQQDWHMEFIEKNLNSFSKSDSLLKIFCTDVLEIGTNIHLLRLLGKLHLIKESKKTIYEELMFRFLDEISIYFDCKLTFETTEVENTTSTVKFPATCKDHCKYSTNFDKLENLIDTSDGFLMTAFEDFFMKNDEEDEIKKERRTLFEEINSITKHLFPAHQIIDRIFSEILYERYGMSGSIIKNLLKEEFGFEKHFEFLNFVFLFKDDIIFPFYSKLFKKFNNNTNWGNDVSLTSTLQDVLLDAFPEFYEKCSVRIKENWKHCKDPVEACNMIEINYKIQWPVNAILRLEHLTMYMEVFRFILKLKWGLYTLNHLFFRDLEKRKKSKKQSYRNIPERLKFLRFYLLNEFTGIQHYVFSYVISTFYLTFIKEFETSNNFCAFIGTHAKFINSVHQSCKEIWEYHKNGFDTLVCVVSNLKKMWSNLKNVDHLELKNCEKTFKQCHNYLDPIIFPKNLYCDYL